MSDGIAWQNCTVAVRGGSCGRPVPREAPLSICGTHMIVTSGAAEYVTVDITETTGQDISGDPCWLSFGTADAPGTWIAAQTTGTGASLAATVLATSATGLGLRWVWLKFTDSPETPIRRIDFIKFA